jgi:hypothetical protein
MTENGSLTIGFFSYVNLIISMTLSNRNKIMSHFKRISNNRNTLFPSDYLVFACVLIFNQLLEDGIINSPSKRKVCFL